MALSVVHVAKKEGESTERVDGGGDGGRIGRKRRKITKMRYEISTLLLNKKSNWSLIHYKEGWCCFAGSGLTIVL